MRMLFLLLLLPACSLLLEDKSAPISFQNVREAEALSVAEAGSAVFNDAASWEAFWYEHVNGFTFEGEPVPPPEIDFRQRTVAAVFLGVRSGCSNFWEVVQQVTVEGEAVTIHVGKPPSSGITCTMVVSPLQVITFEKAETVAFVGI